MDGVDHYRSVVSFIPIHLEEKGALLRMRFKDLCNEKVKNIDLMRSGVFPAPFLFIVNRLAFVPHPIILEEYEEYLIMANCCIMSKLVGDETPPDILKRKR
jgi:hypothetical protein